MNNTINLDNFSFKAFTASLGLSKILPAVVTMGSFAFLPSARRLMEKPLSPVTDASTS